VNRRDTTPYLIKALLGCALALQGAPSPAQDQAPDKTPPAVSAQVAPQADRTPSEYWVLTLSPYTYHWNYSPEHKPVFMVSMHEHLPGNRLCGISLFSNSFGQPSAYVYAGQQFDQLFGSPQLSLNVTAGILYGYVGQYKDKVPFNHHGFSPAIIPALSYSLGPRDALQLDILGKAAVMFAYARKF